MEAVIKLEKRTKAISRKTLATLIELMSSKSKFKTYKDIAIKLNSEFQLNLTEDDIVDFFAIDIEEEDRRLIYKHMGYGS